MAAKVIGKLRNPSGEVKMIEIAPKIPTEVDKEGERGQEWKQEESRLQEKEQFGEREETPAPAENMNIPPVVRNISKKETKFFSEPKKVRKKTEGSILGFQVITSFVFCLLLLLSRLGAPQLYDNLQLFLSRVFR